MKHIPILLEFAHAEQSDIDAALNNNHPVADASNSNDDEAFTLQDEDAEDEADGVDAVVDDDEHEMPRLLADARSWDRFRALCYAMRPFAQDDIGYRKERAVETFNAAALVMAEYKRLHPQAVSACPHVALCVVPRQMVEHGDPGRRSTDHSESYGASIKESIHRRCLRRRKSMIATTHRRRNENGEVVRTWTQRALSVSRVMQTFRDQSVRERVIRDEESLPYLLRQHYKLAATGFSTVGEAAVIDDKLSSILERMSEARDLA
eukprot:CAMPEP_0182796480 /NCGR_PEP_ID=MMETSP0006_2-20121128/295_1 /TAXON_ID=97485 /ORGANISM="Prymnesium parvum, Strain Texoma1" /LENGTH=263 /DNA_ID=CAMNT_0024921445 /DNA_START=1243 /DNA_END=2035 /DNA_ORIENTATION=+